jgi:hypothetical protein
MGLCGLLLVAGFAVSPGRAYAQGSGATDCTNGCYIFTCAQNGNCDVWYCNGSSGCHLVGSFRRPDAKTVMGEGKPTEQGPGRFAYAKLCSKQGTCDLYRLGDGRAVLLGTFADIDAEVKRLQAESTPDT